MLVLVRASSLAPKQLWTFVPIVLGYRIPLGAVGGPPFLMQSFVDLVLIRPLQPVQLPVGQRLLHRPTADPAVPAGWATGTGAGASSDATEAAAAGHGGALRCHMGIDRFRPVWQGARGCFCCCLRAP